MPTKKNKTGARVREFRLHLKLSQAMFGEIVGKLTPKGQPISGMWIAHYEKDRRRPSVDVGMAIVRLARDHDYPLTIEGLYGKE